MSRMMRLLNTKTWFRAIIYQVTPIKENSRTLVRKNKKPKINTKKTSDMKLYIKILMKYPNLE